MGTEGTPLNQSRSFRPTVRLRGKGCALHRHFRRSLKQVISYLEKLAENDPERFVWPGVENISQHARDWSADPSGQAGCVFSVRQVQRNLRRLEGASILVPAKRYRGGCRRSGWVVREHPHIDDEQTSCSLFLPLVSLTRPVLSPPNGPNVTPVVTLNVTPARAEASPEFEPETTHNQPASGTAEKVLPEANTPEHSGTSRESRDARSLKTVRSLHNTVKAENHTLTMRPVSTERCIQKQEPWKAIGLEIPCGEPGFQVAWTNYFSRNADYTIQERAGRFLAWVKENGLESKLGIRFYSALQNTAASCD
jgi:hypothetical protein